MEELSSGDSLSLAEACAFNALSAIELLALVVDTMLTNSETSIL